MKNLNGKKILLIICGGIAVYKSLELIRHLQSENFEIIPVLTNSASNFITSLSISAISKNKVYTDLFDLNDESEMGHIQLFKGNPIYLSSYNSIFM